MATFITQTKSAAPSFSTQAKHSSTTDFLLKEDGGFLLQENSGKFILDQSGFPWTTINKS
jgi:hypothetical protein